MNDKKYEKPAIVTVEVPERTAYACNLGNETCPHASGVVNHAICSDNGGQGSGLWGIGVCD
ncbi:MAG: hypothetical protein HWN68_00820 [Desulfobacterales bacterium]|nr:hypothetical protein [Desulfobacterales bacterium]